MSYEAILFEKKEHVATITLNRPEKLNVRNPKMGGELLEAFGIVDEDEDVRVVVITGAGRAFCAGADIKERFLLRIENRKKGIEEDVTRDFAETGCLALAKIRKPVIASINGAAVGLGCTLALACDVRIASEKATFGLPFGRMGLPPEFGSTYFLPRLIGMGKACELIFTGKIITAQEAREIGLVNQVVPHEKLGETTDDTAKGMLKMAPLSLQFSKRALYQGLSATHLSSQLQYESFAMNYLSRTEDHEEAVRAFLEKRDPVFKGK